MHRTQIQLTTEQFSRLRRFARTRGVSMAEAVRQCVDLTLADQQADRTALYDRASRVIGAFEEPTGITDLSANHDAYLQEAFE